MAFSVYLAHSDDICDKCKKATDEPVLIVKQSDRTDKNFIYVHKSCLLKSIAKAEAETA